MDNDDLTILDVENAILTGQIVECQKDRETRETKYLVRGEGIEGMAITVVAKFGFTGRLIILTVYVGNE